MQQKVTRSAGAVRAVWVAKSKCCQWCLNNKTNKNYTRYMKKTYVSPLMVEVNVEAESMLAASLKLDNDKTVDTSNGGQLSGGSRGQWGNLWD